ncbi:adhesion G protein-coupled receptor E1 isoform X2 [Chanodichthys erythropterus]|uniref:adhesion G protein-coupled receptor E1 isoform X2 n=1 Tax=Chanodichthys erythropterus TaxID=933992 RepID=UPI00351E52B2
MRHIYLLSLGILLTLTESTAADCPEGYEIFRGKCVDEDECKSEPPICGENATCNNTIGSFHCLCQEGFTPTHNFTQVDGIKCQDINECVNQSIDCGPNAKCVNSEGGYFCTCETGYFSSNGNKTFIDRQGIQCIGFCDIDKSICGEGGVCHNSKDGHECVCRSGFTNYGHKQMKCTDINECVDQSIDCGPNAECTNSEGGYFCTCKTGYFSSSGKEIFIAGQGIQCFGCDIIYSNFCIRQD